MSAILKLYFRFRFDLLIIMDIGILHRGATFKIVSVNRSRDIEGVPKF